MTFLEPDNSKFTIKKPYRYLIDWDGKSLSKFQKRVKDYLRQKWEDDYVYEEFPVGKTRLRFDFYNATKKIVTESDGLSHYQTTFHNNTKEKLLNQFKRDHYKEIFCEINNIQLIRIREDLPIEEQFKNFKL